MRTHASENLLYLKPGGLLITKKPVVIKTILGSCISIVLRCSYSGITAISHAQLPEEYSKGSCIDSCPKKCGNCADDGNQFKYVTCSTHHMLDEMLLMGVKKQNIEVKLFGGANVLSAMAGQHTIGQQNIVAAHRLIKDMVLNIVSEDTGGHTARTIFLDTSTGKVRVKKID